ncbi:MAG: hypothetical protein PHY55_06245 [Bacteroidales bacterium]|nr:hypothetical protein [Bacteroidales bacterium]
MDSKTYLIKELLSDLSSVGLNSIADRIIQEALPLEDLLELNFHSDRRISFRSAWVMEKIAYRDITLIAPVFSQILERYNTLHNPSLARHYNKILLLVFEMKTKNTLPQELNTILENTDREKIIEGCFKWILMPKCPVAALVWSIEILMYHTESHPWLKEELPPIIQKLSLNTTSGQKNYCSKAYKRLMKNH